MHCVWGCVYMWVWVCLHICGCGCVHGWVEGCEMLKSRTHLLICFILMILLYLFQKTQNHQVVSKMLNHVSRIHTMGENHKYITRHTLNNTHYSISFKWRAKTGKPRLRRTSTFWIIVVQCSVVQNHKHCCKFGAGHVSSLQGTAISQSQHHRGDSHCSLAYFAPKLYLEVMCSKFIFYLKVLSTYHEHLGV